MLLNPHNSHTHTRRDAQTHTHTHTHTHTNVCLQNVHAKPYEVQLSPQCNPVTYSGTCPVQSARYVQMDVCAV